MSSVSQGVSKTPAERKGAGSKYYHTDAIRISAATKQCQSKRRQALDIAFKDIQRRMKETSDVEGKKSAFHSWCREHALELYPHLGHVSYAVPPFFIRKDFATSESEIRGAITSSVQESEIKGDKAHQKVARALRLMNIRLETARKPTMFIIIGNLYENIFICLRNASDIFGEDYVRQHYPDVCTKQYYSVPQECGTERHESDIMVIHPHKGVIFFQVKGVGAFKGTKDDVIKSKIDHMMTQLDHDDKVLSCVMGKELTDVVIQVVALPNIKKAKLTSLQLHSIQSDTLKFLCKEDLFDDCIQQPESELNIKPFETWWDSLPNKELKEFRLEDFVARYVGVVSTPVSCLDVTLSGTNQTKTDDSKERSQIRHMNDALFWTACNFKRLIVTEEIMSHLKSTDKKKVFLNGPPGSGRTMILVLKAQDFLRQERNNRIIVVNIYRGAKGRPFGQTITDAIKAFEVKGQARVHHLRIDINDENVDFVTEVQKLVSKSKVALGQTMFVLDELHKAQYWRPILESFSSEFKESWVWCSGIFCEPSDLTEFEVLELSRSVRCPPAIQAVLYHVDWDNQRRAKYAHDTACKEVVTNGPNVLSIRHGEHHPVTNVTECCLCALELICLLKDKSKLNLLYDFTKPSSGQAHADEVGKLPCSITVLFSIPRSEYTTSHVRSDYVEISDKQCETYIRYVSTCLFVETLKKESSLEVNVITDLSGVGTAKPESWSEISIAWVDTFQGLERDVVIFLPGDGATGTGHVTDATPAQPCREQSWLSGYNQGEPPEGQATENMTVRFMHTGTASNKVMNATPTISTSHSRLKPALGMSSIRQSPTTEAKYTYMAQSDDRKLTVEAHSKDDITVGLGSYYWTTADIEKLTDWDKTNLFQAGSCCVSQLILIVP